MFTKQKSYKCDNQLITWLTGITRPAGSCNLVTLKTNFAQYKNFVCCCVKFFLSDGYFDFWEMILRLIGPDVPDLTARSLVVFKKSHLTNFLALMSFDGPKNLTSIDGPRKLSRVH